MGRMIFVVVSMLAMLPAFALDMDAWGLRLGDRLAVAQCPYKADPSGKLEYETPDTPGPACFRMAAGPISGRANGEFGYELPYVEWPSIANWRRGIRGYALDGRVESVEFNTYGIRNGDKALRVLQEKYGKPTSLREDRLETPGGAKFNAISATWRLGNLYVDFDSAHESLDIGTVHVYTKKYAARAGRASDEARREPAQR